MMSDEFLNSDYFKQISSFYKETQSLQKTAERMGVAYGKVRKILITLGEYQTEFSMQVTELRKKGFSISEIAMMIGATEKRVNAFLPYAKGIYEAPVLTTDAKKSKKYRKRIEVATNNIITKKYASKNKTINEKERERVMMKNQFVENKNVYPVHLHLELRNEWCDEEEKRVLTKYADATNNGTLTRDILIPSDMPLHNLHYVIQRLYGWQNSHLRCFRLEEKDYERLTVGKVKEWVALVGVLFQGLQDDGAGAFWDDMYSGGSFKVWLKKKYTGPYSYGGYTENYKAAKESVQQLVKHFPEVDVKESFHDYYERTKGKEGAEREPIRILKKAPILNLTLEELNNSILIEGGMDHLLERLEVISVLGVHEDKLAKASELGKRLVNPAYESNNGTPSGMEQPEVLPVTRKLLYNYDYGDNWIVEITRSDSLQNIDISDEELNQAKQLVLDKHKPVCISKKGGYVVDDVGGMQGYADFLKTIYESAEKEERKQYREWAESLGWSSRNVSIDKMV